MKRHRMRNIGFLLLVVCIIMVIAFYPHQKPAGLYGYLGSILPLQVDQPLSLTAERQMKVQFDNEMNIEDEYKLSNKTQENLKVKLYYPYIGNLSDSYLVDVWMDNEKKDSQIIFNRYLGEIINQETTVLPGNKDELKVKISNQDNQLSDNLQKRLQQKMYVYEIVDRQYPENEEVKYLQIKSHQLNDQCFYYGLEPSEQSNTYILNMNNNEFSQTPRVISPQPIDDFEMIGYANSKMKEKDENVKARIQTKEMLFKDIITECIDDNIRIFNPILFQRIDKESVHQIFYQQMDNLYTRTKSLQTLNLTQYSLDNGYFQFYNEIDIPANSTITMHYKFKNEYNHIISRETDSYMDYLPQYLSSLQFSKQLFSIEFLKSFEIIDNNMGLDRHVTQQTVELDTHQEYYIKLKRTYS